MKRRMLLVASISLMLTVNLVYGQVQSPGQVIKEFYTLANMGKYKEAQQYWSEDFRFAMDRCLGIITGGPEVVLDNATKKGTIERVKIKKEEIRGQKAEVSYTIYFKDGSKREATDDMVFEGGGWKINFKVVQ